MPVVADEPSTLLDTVPPLPPVDPDSEPTESDEEAPSADVPLPPEPSALEPSASPSLPEQPKTNPPAATTSAPARIQFVITMDFVGAAPGNSQIAATSTMNGNFYLITQKGGAAAGGSGLGQK